MHSGSVVIMDGIQNSYPLLILGGEWRFIDDTDGNWRWSVRFAESLIISPQCFATRDEALEDAQLRGYGRKIPLRTKSPDVLK